MHDLLRETAQPALYHSLVTYPSAEILAISFRSLLRGRFLDVTQRSPQIKVSLWGALHDIQKLRRRLIVSQLQRNSRFLRSSRTGSYRKLRLCDVYLYDNSYAIMH